MVLAVMVLAVMVLAVMDHVLPSLAPDASSRGWESSPLVALRVEPRDSSRGRNARREQLHDGSQTRAAHSSRATAGRGGCHLRQHGQRGQRGQHNLSGACLGISAKLLLLLLPLLPLLLHDVGVERPHGV
ncbi:unnamed protein product [Lampetra fluviatilis]